MIIFIMFYSTSRRASRILGRRYALTSTSYKYLDIAISVGPMSCVELILSDNRYNCIVLPISTWTSLMQKRAEIEELVQSESATSISINDFSISFTIMHGSKIVKLSLFDGNSLYMRPATLLRLFDFEKCIDHMYLWLCENTYLVSEKFKQFVTVLQRNSITNVRDAVKAIRNSSVFNSESLIDCELLTCAIQDVFYDACNK